MNIDTHQPKGTLEVRVYAVFAETWRGTDKIEENYWNATEDREKAERDLEHFQSKHTTIFHGKHEGKQGMFLNARVVSRVFTITATNWG